MIGRRPSPTTTVGQVVAALVLVIAAVGPIGPAITPASAQSGSLTMRSQSFYVPAEGTYQLVFDWSGDVDESLTFGGTIFAPVDDETELGEPGRAAFKAIPQLPLTDLARTPDGGFVFELPLRSVPDADPDRTLIREAGVFPIGFEVRQDGNTRATLDTTLIRLPGETAEITGLDVAMLLEVSSAEGLTLDQAIQLLTDHPLLPMAVQLGDGVITQLEADLDVTDQLRAALGDRPVIVSPLRNLDASALAGIGREDLYADARTETLARIEALGLVPDRSSLPLATNLTDDGVRFLAGQGVELIIDTAPGVQPPGVMQAVDASMSIIEPDEQLTRELRGGPRSVERVHRLIARLSIRGQEDRTPVVLGGDALRVIPIDSIDTFLSSFDAVGLLAPASLAAVAEESAVFPIRPDEQPTQNLDDAAATVDRLLATIVTYDQFHVSGQRPPEQYSALVTEALSPDLNPADRLRALDRLEDSLTADLGGIDLPDGQSVTLAAQRAEIPITVNNTTDGTREVLLSFTSDKIRVAQDQTTLRIPPGISTIEIDLEALSLGQSPLEVAVFTPDQSTELARTRFGVRSTAIPGLGLLLSAAALVFLLGWWIVSITKTRAVRRHPSSHDEEVEPEAVAT